MKLHQKASFNDETILSSTTISQNPNFENYSNGDDTRTLLFSTTNIKKDTNQYSGGFNTISYDPPLLFKSDEEKNRILSESVIFNRYAVSNASSFLSKHENKKRNQIFRSVKGDIMRECNKLEGTVE